jgi:RimJ/RimL family protein N-acetyltransferase
MRLDLGCGNTLSEFRPSDREALVALLADPAVSGPLLRIPFPYSENDAENWLTIVAASTRKHEQPVHFAIRDAGDALIGACGFNDFEIGRSHRAEIGYWLGRDYWGRGIMTRAVRAACEHAFARWFLVKISAWVFAENLASCRVLEKCGFVQEGYFKYHYRKDGRLIDARAFGLLAPTVPVRPEG